MKEIKLPAVALLIFILSFVLFAFLEIGLSFDDSKKLIIPSLFAFSLTTMILFSSLRKFFLYGSLALLLTMVFFYLLNQILIANWVGSLGFGILVITVVCYLPILIKKGYIERF